MATDRSDRPDSTDGTDSTDSTARAGSNERTVRQERAAVPVRRGSTTRWRRPAEKQGTRQVRRQPRGLTDDVPPDAPLLELEIGAIAHGGHCVARHEGRVVFVRHTLPGERVMARLTQAAPDATLWRADAVEILEASADRVPSAWPAAGPGGVGGGELAHVSLPAQRRWKAAVVAEQLQRLAHDDREVTVEGAPGDDDRGGLAWRTRIELVVDDEGRAGMRGHRSHRIHALDSMPLAVEQIAALDLFSRRWPVDARIEAVAPVGGDAPVVLVDGQPWDLERHRPDAGSQVRTTVHESVTARGREYGFRVAADGFWQVHREAPQVLVEAVLDAVSGSDLVGATVLDLYSGAGLFTGPLAEVVGPTGQLVAVEGDERAVRDARRNLHHAHNVTLLHGDVSHVLADDDAADTLVHTDVVVLDPPRTGAGRRVVEQIGALHPERVVYVACDPAALARDVSYLAEVGVALDSVRAFDLFPMTHHVECVAVFTR